MSWYEVATAEAFEMNLPVIKYGRERDLAFIDIETTGLVASRHNIIEIAAYKPGDTVGFEARIQVSRYDILRAEPKALEVNGYSDELWEDATPFYDAMNGFFRYINGCDLAGHNICSFDIPFINYSISATPFHGMLDGYISPAGYVAKPRIVDTLALSKMVLSQLGLKKYSLDASLEFLGLERETVHRALGGAKASYRLMQGIADLVKSGYNKSDE